MLRGQLSAFQRDIHLFPKDRIHLHGKFWIWIGLHMSFATCQTGSVFFKCNYDRLKAGVPLFFSTLVGWTCWQTQDKVTQGCVFKEFWSSSSAHRRSRILVPESRSSVIMQTHYDSTDDYQVGCAQMMWLYDIFVILRHQSAGICISIMVHASVILNLDP